MVTNYRGPRRTLLPVREIELDENYWAYHPGVNPGQC